MRWLLWAGALVWGLEAGGQAQNSGKWLVWWAEGQKAARETGKPIFLVFR